jgi:hypothetical protein
MQWACVCAGLAWLFNTRVVAVQHCCTQCRPATRNSSALHSATLAKHSWRCGEARRAASWSRAVTTAPARDCEPQARHHTRCAAANDTPAPLVPRPPALPSFSAGSTPLMVVASHQLGFVGCQTQNPSCCVQLYTGERSRSAGPGWRRRHSDCESHNKASQALGCTRRTVSCTKTRCRRQMQLLCASLTSVCGVGHALQRKGKMYGTQAFEARATG